MLRVGIEHELDCAGTSVVDAARQAHRSVRKLRAQLGGERR